MSRMIVAILISLGLGAAGGGLYFSDGTEVTDPQIIQICEEISSLSCNGICVTDTVTFKDGDGVEYTTDREELINFKKSR